MKRTWHVFALREDIDNHNGFMTATVIAESFDDAHDQVVARWGSRTVTGHLDGGGGNRVVYCPECRAK